NWQMQMIKMTPRERFLNFVMKNPELLQRVPQNYLASYLNINPETFSRFKHLPRRNGKKNNNNSGAQRHTENHHHQKAADKSEYGTVRVFVALCFGNYFFHHYKDHGTCSEGEGKGQYRLHIDHSPGAEYACHRFHYGG